MEEQDSTMQFNSLICFAETYGRIWDIQNRFYNNEKCNPVLTLPTKVPPAILFNNEAPEGVMSYLLRGTTLNLDLRECHFRRVTI